MNLNHELEPEIEKEFRLFQESYQNIPVDLSSERASFLLEAQKLARVVTESKKQRHNIWIEKIAGHFLIRKDKKRMLNAFATLAVLLSIILGGGGATVAYAQSSLPDQALYGIKLISEDVRQAITTDPQSEWQLALDLSERRIEEIRALSLSEGTAPQTALVERYQNQLEQALRYAVNLPDEQAVQALEKVRLSLQSQQGTINQVRVQNNQNAEAALLTIQNMIQERLNWVEEGLQSPDLLRDRIQLHDQQRDQLRDQDHLLTPVDPTLQTTLSGLGTGNPWTDETPTPGSGYGPGKGDGTCELCTPSPKARNGGTPITDSTATSGQNNGNGSGSNNAPAEQPGNNNSSDQGSGSGGNNSPSNGGGSGGSGGSGNGKH